MNASIDEGAAGADAGMELLLPVQSNARALWILLIVVLTGTPALCFFGYSVCAGLLVMVVVLEMLLALQRLRRAPVALCGQGMRWWLVNRDGELTGPFWLDEQTRHGASWMTLCLRNADKRRHYVLLGRWSMNADVWQQLKWRVLAQAQHLRKV